MPALTAIRGFKDILPGEAGLWRLVEEKARETLARYDFMELRPPVMERAELFQRGIGQATDIVEKEMYALEDRSGELIALRPEATAGMVRALIEHNLHEGARSARLFCLGPMFRYERPQKGRLRQFHQLDAEIFADPGPWADAEIIALLHDYLFSLGLPSLTMVINSLGCPKCRPAYRESLVAFLSARKGALCPDCQRRLSRNALRVLDCKSPSCQAQLTGAPTFSAFWCQECQDHFQAVREALNSLGLRFAQDDRLVRGLDYYTRTTFEARSGDLGAQSAVAGGGRYDGLCQELGGPDIPAIGFAAGLERLVILLSEKGLPGPPGPDYYLAILTPEALGPAFRLASALRGRGHSVAADWEAGGLKSRLKRADKAGAAKAVMIGPDELASGQATVRDLATKEQSRLALDKPELF